MEPISRIDPTVNKLYFRGLDATELAQTSDYESVLYLLIHGELPNDSQRVRLIRRMIKLRDLYSNDIITLERLLDRLSDLRELHRLDLHDTLLTYVTLCPFVIAAQYAQNQNLEFREPDKKLGHAANFLWMIKGTPQLERDVYDFQTALILPMDDPNNPSLSALTSALKKGDEIEALREALRAHVGPLHHGAGSLAMSMFDEIRSPENVRRHLEDRLKSGEKIYGIGHRIYTGFDPRAVVLREILERRTMNTSDDWILHIADAVAREGKIILAKQKGIDAHPNIDLFNAAVYVTFGLPAELNTQLFAVSRAAGWMAHILEMKSE
jgi:citrate synthase